MRLRVTSSCQALFRSALLLFAVDVLFNFRIMNPLSLDKRGVNHTQNGTGFNFQFLWNIALAINASDPTSDSLFHPKDNQTRICLTYGACVANVGPGSIPYSRRDVYDRVLLWRVPLIALIATTTLPALVSINISHEEPIETPTVWRTIQAI